MKKFKSLKHIPDYNENTMSLFLDGNSINDRLFNTDNKWDRITKDIIEQFVSITDNFGHNNIKVVYCKPFKGFDKHNQVHYKSKGYYFVAYLGISDVPFEKWTDDMESLSEELHAFLVTHGIEFN